MFQEVRVADYADTKADRSNDLSALIDGRMNDLAGCRQSGGPF